MNLSSLLRILWRQRRYVLPSTVLAVVLCLSTIVVVPPTYRASASVVLLNPPALPETTPNNPSVPPQFLNPYARFNDLSVIVDILVRVLGSQPIVDSLTARGLDGTFEIAANRDFYRGPIIDLSSETKNRGDAIKNTKLLVAELQDQLNALQQAQGTDPSYWIRAQPVVDADKESSVFSPTLRLLIVAIAFGLVLVVGVGLLADFRERRRAGPRRRKAERELLTVRFTGEPHAIEPIEDATSVDSADFPNATTKAGNPKADNGLKRGARQPRSPQRK